DATVNAWLSSHQLGSGCTQDGNFSETMVCHETGFLRRDAAIRIGNFATAIGVQDKATAAGDLRLIVPTRGDPSITWGDYDGAGPRLTCSAAAGAAPPPPFGLCDDAHRLVHLRADPNEITISDEPFDVFVDSANGFGVVTHLTSGSVTLISLPKDGTPVLSDAIGGLFGADPVTGLVGASAVAGRSPGAPDDIVYVASRTEGRIQTLTVTSPYAGQPSLLEPGLFFFLDGVGSQSGSSRDSRGMVFGSGGDRMYLINRAPPTLQVYDTSLTAQ